MEFKKVPKRSRPQSAASLPHRPQPTKKTVTQNESNGHTQSILSGRSPNTKTPQKNHAHNSLRAYLFSKKATVILAVALIIVIGLLVNRPTTQNTSENQTAQQNQESPRDSSQAKIDNKATTPTYDTVTPKGKNIEELGGWKRVSPATSAPVFAYTDKIGDVAINVSQQPLPDTFKNDIDAKTADLAKRFNATTSFDIGATKAYIGTSAKGPQSVIFTTKTLLILIKSQKNIDTGAWSNYIKSLT